MTKFYVDGANYVPYADNQLKIISNLPAKTYSLDFNKTSEQFFLVTIEENSNNNKIYGDVPKSVDRVVNTFIDRSNSTGILLSGEKGCGKTLFSKLLSLKCQSLGIPTIIINTAYCGEQFNKFIQSIDQPCVILFDEFEKVYNSDQQKMLLTILDGTYSTKKLFVMTCNDIWKIDGHMKNRPGRLFYHLKYYGLDANFVEEYAEDNLLEQYKHMIKDLKRLPSLIRNFNFDMIKAIVEDINRYGESVKETLKFINIEMDGNAGKYNCTLLDPKGDKVETNYITEYFNPLIDDCDAEFDIQSPEKSQDGPNAVSSNDDNDDSIEMSFSPKDICSVEDNQNKITYKKDGYTLLCIKKDTGNYNLLDKLF